MKLSIICVSFFSLLLMGVGLLWAAPGDLSCRGALNQLTRAQETVQVKQREVQRAKSTTKTAFAVIEVCQLRIIANAKTIRDCVAHRAEVPRKVQNLIEVESELQDAIKEFQTVFEQMSRVCLEPRSHHVITGGRVYP